MSEQTLERALRHLLSHADRQRKEFSWCDAAIQEADDVLDKLSKRLPCGHTNPDQCDIHCSTNLRYWQRRDAPSRPPPLPPDIPVRIGSPIGLGLVIVFAAVILAMVAFTFT